MSFILDALKKSEHARQSQAGPSLADVQLHRPRGERPWWAILIAALLAVNMLVLILVLTREPAEPAPAPSPAPTTAVSAPAPAPVPQPSPAVPRQAAPVAPGGAQVSLRTLAGQPPSDAALETVELTPLPVGQTPPVQPFPAQSVQPAIISPAPPPPPPTPAPQTPGEVLPTADELLAAGTRLPELHLDIHVTAEDAAQRFVFINMRKYAEGDTLSEGPRLERITPDGAILNQHGLRFLLPRQ